VRSLLRGYSQRHREEDVYESFSLFRLRYATFFPNVFSKKRELGSIEMTGCSCYRRLINIISSNHEYFSCSYLFRASIGAALLSQCCIPVFKLDPLFVL